MAVVDKHYKAFGLVIVKRYQAYQTQRKQLTVQLRTCPDDMRDVLQGQLRVLMEWCEQVEAYVQLCQPTVQHAFRLRVLLRLSWVQCAQELHVSQRTALRCWDALAMYLGETYLRQLSVVEAAKWRREGQATRLDQIEVSVIGAKVADFADDSMS